MAKGICVNCGDTANRLKEGRLCKRCFGIKKRQDKEKKRREENEQSN